MSFTCKCSFLEIYNEQIFDLLDLAPRALNIREDAQRGVYVEGISEEDAGDVERVMDILARGSRNRRVAATSMNRESSRSHSVFTLKLASGEKVRGMVRRRYSVLNLIDLAGSERQKSTGSTGLRLKEAANINRSLSNLGNVINALVDVERGHNRHVHYRDSKLTFLLRVSWCANAWFG